ncbi:MAG TPA: homoserine kinase [Gemmatimonadaceae bacterium]|nr:homoserine kinase [Gemmatimonadaceae bacterium]
MTPPLITRASVRVPATTSNLGAGFDCVGVALDRWLRVDVEVRHDDRQLVHIHRSGTLRALDATGISNARDDLLYIGFRAALDRCSGFNGFSGSVYFAADSDIPVARGLGSSAAALLAGAALANATLGLMLSVDELVQICARIEGHGDNVAPAALGGAILVSPRAPWLSFSPLLVSDALGFAFAIPDFECHTDLARAALPTQVPFATAVGAAARAAALVQGLSTGDRDLLTVGLDDELHVPHRLPLVPFFEHVAHAARAAGAYGATLSGSGSAMVAIAPRAVAAQVSTAMAGAWRSAGIEARGFATGVGLAGLSVVFRSNSPTLLPSYSQCP